MSLLELIKCKNIEKAKKNNTLRFIEISDLINKKLLYSIPEIPKENTITKKNVLIAFEGINCCGKSTQIKKLQKYFTDQNINAATIRDNDNACWDILSKTGKGTYLINEPLQDNFLWPTYFINQYKSNQETINSNVAIFDRYKLSVKAIQKGIFLSHNILFNDKIFFEDSFSSIPDPDVGIFIDIPIDTMKERYAQRGGRCCLSSYDLQLTAKIKEIFKDFAKEEGYLIIDGTKKPDILFEEIKKYITREE